jgi:hypothetical protein
LTDARPTRLTSAKKKRRWPHDRRRRFCRSSGRATPSRRRDKIETPRVQQTPAEVHLKSAGSCPDNRGQLSPAAANAWIKARIASLNKHDWEFFLSYSKADLTEARFVDTMLREAGFKVFAQFHNIPVGSNFVREMQAGLDGAGRVIALYSPD